MGCSSTSLMKPEGPGPEDESRPPSWMHTRMSSFRSSFSRDSRSSHNTHKKLTVSMERQVERYAYPSATPPRKRKAEIFKKENLTEVDNHAKSMPIKVLYGSMRDVTRYLTQPYATDVEKLRSLFIWVTTVNVNKLQFCLDKLPMRNSPLEMLLHIHWKMESHAHFFALLCRAAGLPSVLVMGVTKSLGYRVGDKMDRRTMAANWNAVYCDGDWRFVDIFLAKLLVPGYKQTDWISLDQPDEDEVFCQLNCKSEDTRINEAYFLTDPDQLIYIHFPDDPVWQLLHRSVTQEQFEETVFLRERYFQFGLHITIPPDYDNELTLTSDDGQVFFEFSIPEEKAKTCHFRYALSKQRKNSKHPGLGLDKCVLYQKGRDFIRYQAKLPIKGTYKFTIFGKDDEEHDAMDLCASFIIICSAEECLDREPYPECPAIGFAPGLEAEKLGVTPKSHEAPIIDSIDGNIEIRFGVECRLTRTFLQSLKHNAINEVMLKQNVTTRLDHCELIINVRLQRQGIYTLSLFAKRPGIKGEFPNICNYILRCHQSTTQKQFPRLHEGIIGAGIHAEWFHIHPKHHTDDRIHTSTGQVLVEMQSDDAIPVEMLCELHNNELDTYSLSECVTSIVKEGHMHLFEMSLPQKGEYAVNIYARKTGEQACRVYHVHTYFIESTQTTGHSVQAANYQLELIQRHVTANAVVIRLPEGDQPRTMHLLQKNAQLDDVPDQVLVRHTNSKEVFRVHLPEHAEYRLDIFDENKNKTLNQCAQYQIIHNKPSPGEVDLEEEGVEVSEDRFECTERNKLQAMHDLYRDNMHNAMKHHDIKTLNAALIEFESHEVPEVDGDLSRAKLILDYLQVDNTLSHAMLFRDIDELELALHHVVEFGVGMKLGLKLKMAHKIRNQLRHLEQLQKDTVLIDDRLIEAFRDMPQPHEKLLKVVKAMYILLGIEDKHLKTWQAMQSIMRTTHKDNFKRRIVVFKVEKISLETVQKANHYLKDISYAEVRTLSKTCGIFYLWAHGMIQEAERRHAKKKLDSWGSAPDARAKKNHKSPPRSKSW